MTQKRWLFGNTNKLDKPLDIVPKKNMIHFSSIKLGMKRYTKDILLKSRDDKGILKI